MSFEINLERTCIVCLQENHNLRSAYDSIAEGDPDLRIMDMISQCSVFRLESITRLPLKVCGACMNDLLSTLRFQQNCQEAASLLGKIIENAKREERELNRRSQVRAASTLPKGPAEGSVASILDIVEEGEDEPEEDAERVFLEIENNDHDSDFGEIKEDLHAKENVAQDDDEQGEYEDYVALDEEQQILEDPPEELREHKEQEENVPNGFNLPTRGRGRPRKYPKNENCTEPGNAATKLKNRDSFRKRGLPKPPQICDICGNTYKYQHALKAHMRRHANERPYTCEFCDKGFVSGVELRRHMRVHTGQKPYVCRYCPRSFSDFGSRIKHERTHTGERPYKCNDCGKCFAYAHVLNVHIRTHTGQKRFICHICSKGFTKKIYLQSHLNTHQMMDNIIMEKSNSKLQVHGHNAEVVVEGVEAVGSEECILTTEYIITEGDAEDAMEVMVEEF